MMARLWVTLCGVVIVALVAAAIAQSCKNVREYECEVAQLDIIGNKACYEDTQCMLTGEDFRSMIKQQYYVKENCNQRKTSEVFEETPRLEEADPGLSVWAGGEGTS